MVLLLASTLCLAIVAQPVRADAPAGATPASPATLPATEQNYAGSASCAECHAAIYEDWQKSHHALAQRSIEPNIDRIIFSSPAVAPSQDPAFAVEWASDAPRMTLSGPAGKPLTTQPAGVIGYRPLFQYLIPTDPGRLQVTQIAYDPAFKEWFDVFGNDIRKPGDWGHWTGRGMNWNSMCAYCHTTAFQKNYDPAADRYRSQYLEAGIGCEQCHGPMADHGEWQRAHRDQKGDPTIIKYSRDQQQSMCGSCHARRVELTEGFRLGDTFDQHYDLALPDVSDVFYPDGQVRDEDFEYTAFSLSAMYQAGVRCLDCHSPHTGKRLYTGDMICLRCHEPGVPNRTPIKTPDHTHHPPGSPGSACVDCHMPQTHYMQRHARRDHGMTIPTPLLTRQFDIPNACNRCHDDQSVDWAQRRVDAWYGKRMDRPGIKRAQLLARLKQRDLTALGTALDWLAAEPHSVWRAVGLKFLTATLPLLQTQEMSARVHEQIAKLVNDPLPMVQAAAIEALEACGAPWPRLAHNALISPSRLVRLKAASALRNELEPGHRALQDLERYLRLHVDQPVGAFQYANYLAERGQPSEALPWFEKAIAWDAASAPYRHGLAIALHSLNRSNEAVEQLKKAAAIAPEDAAYPYALALLYGELKQIGQAADALRDAVDRDPGMARAWYNLGLAEAELNRLPAAVEALRRAEQIEPQTADYPFARATLHQRMGQRREFIEALQRTLAIEPQHEQAQSLLSN